MTLLETLREKGIISEEVLNDVQGKTLNERDALDFLLKQNIITAEQLAQVRSQLSNLPLTSLEKDFKVPDELFEIFPQKIITQLKIIPIRREENTVEVGIVEPENLEVDAALDFICVSNDISIKRFVIPVDEFEKITKTFSELKAEVAQALEKLGEEKEIKEGVQKKITSQIELQRLAEQAPVTRIVDVILRYGVDVDASDIHIEPTSNQTRVRFRVNGKLKASLFLPKEILPALVARIKVLARLRVDETRVPQDGRIHLRFESQTIDFRVAILPTIEGEKVALRILDPTRGITSLEKLGLQLKSLKDVKTFMEKPFGAMLISGPTGSGKSTTLYTILRDLNKENLNIITLEDPVEYYLSGINQSQVRPEVNYTFASGLREILRQDPNIIMVGEVRDNETASLVIHAALTGHLVFSTIHTNNAIGIIPRLLNMGVDNFLIPLSLEVVVAQRLIPKICQNCKTSYDPPEPIKEIIKDEVRHLSSDVLNQAGLPPKTLTHPTFFRAQGCDACAHAGIIGRIGVFETMTIGQAFEEVVISSPTESSLKKEAMRQGMITMRQDGIVKALQGVVSIESVLTSTETSSL